MSIEKLRASIADARRQGAPDGAVLQIPIGILAEVLADHDRRERQIAELIAGERHLEVERNALLAEVARSRAPEIQSVEGADIHEWRSVAQRWRAIVEEVLAALKFHGNDVKLADMAHFVGRLCVTHDKARELAWWIIEQRGNESAPSSFVAIARRIRDEDPTWTPWWAGEASEGVGRHVTSDQWSDSATELHRRLRAVEYAIRRVAPDVAQHYGVFVYTQPDEEE